MCWRTIKSIEQRFATRSNSWIEVGARASGRSNTFRRFASRTALRSCQDNKLVYSVGRCTRFTKHCRRLSWLNACRCAVWKRCLSFGSRLKITTLRKLRLPNSLIAIASWVASTFRKTFTAKLYLSGSRCLTIQSTRQSAICWMPCRKMNLVISSPHLSATVIAAKQDSAMRSRLS